MGNWNVGIWIISVELHIVFKLTYHPIKKQAFGMAIGLSEFKKADFLKQSGSIFGCISSPQ